MEEYLQSIFPTKLGGKRGVMVQAYLNLGYLVTGLLEMTDAQDFRTR